MNRISGSRAFLLLSASLIALGVMVAQPLLAAFNQAGSSSNTVSAQSAGIQVADNNQTTFAASVQGSLDKFTTNATGLTNDGINRLAGFVDLLHLAGDTSSTKYSIQNAANPAPTANTNHAALNDSLEVIVWESGPQGSGLAAGSTTPAFAACPLTQGQFGGGPISPTVAKSAWKTLSATNLPLPAAGSAIRLCFYLILPLNTPQTAAGGQVNYDLTFTAAP